MSVTKDGRTKEILVSSVGLSQFPEQIVLLISIPWIHTIIQDNAILLMFYFTSNKLFINSCTAIVYLQVTEANNPNSAINLFV